MHITDPKKIKRYYQALIERQSEYVGIFYAGVKTTSIFCIATCSARKPKFENVEFYSQFNDALRRGFRPCKVCKPTENSQPTPAYVQQAVKLVRQAGFDRVKDYQLTQHGIRPEKVRRWFKTHYGITFQAYQRMLRINNAIIDMNQGKSTTASAMDQGYNSLSGFGYTFKKYLGRSPMNNSAQPILIHRFTTVLGPMFVCATDKGVCLLEFVDRRKLETEFADIQRLFKAPILNGENAHTAQAEQEMQEYFSGNRKTFDLTLLTPGTEFQQSVWAALKGIEYGQTSTYQQHAEGINKPKAVRAAATAIGCNRIAIVIPCHRVLGKNGALTGYAGGLERKQWLLDHERQNALSFFNRKVPHQ